MIGTELGHFEITGKLGEGGLINPAPERDRSTSALHLAVNWPAMLEER